MLSPHYPAAVVAGNVETSQHVTNALFGALGAMANSEGTMNNLTFGNDRHQYYETICSGSPAGRMNDGRGFAGTERRACPHDQLAPDRSGDPGAALSGRARGLRHRRGLGRGRALARRATAPRGGSGSWRRWTSRSCRRIAASRRRASPGAATGDAAAPRSTARTAARKRSPMPTRPASGPATAWSSSRQPPGATATRPTDAPAEGELPGPAEPDRAEVDGRRAGRRVRAGPDHNVEVSIRSDAARGGAARLTLCRRRLSFAATIPPLRQRVQWVPGG